MIVRFAFGVLMIAFVAIGGFFPTGCSTESKKDAVKFVDPRYDGWLSHVEENIKVLYPPNHPMGQGSSRYAAQYRFGLKTVPEFLKMNRPTDTIFVFYYTGPGHAEEMTGHVKPYGTGDSIHIWQPNFLGPAFMQLMLERWSDVKPKFSFLRHGLITLFDFSGMNYHLKMKKFLGEGRGITLTGLAYDTTVNSDYERGKSGPSASFVGFVQAKYGIYTLKNLYETDEASFNNAARELFGIDADSLQAEWFAFVNAVPDPPVNPKTEILKKQRDKAKQK